MIDVPPEPPKSTAYTIEQKLVECGLEPNGISIQYEDALQSIEVRISPDARAEETTFPCIFDASEGQIVTFEDASMAVAYQDFMVSVFRTRMLADAEESLAELGLLDDFPNPADFKTDLEFGGALERLCGLQPGSWIKKMGSGLAIIPDDTNEISVDGENWDQFTCLSRAVMYSALKYENFKIGFVGNEAFSEEGQ